MSIFNQIPHRIIAWQATLTLVVSVVLYPAFGLVAAYSALTGGMISTIANAVFALRLFSNKEGWQIGQLTAATYRGVVGKIFLTIALFLLAVLLLKPLNATALFVVFLLIQVSPAIIVAILNRT